MFRVTQTTSANNALIILNIPITSEIPLNNEILIFDESDNQWVYGPLSTSGATGPTGPIGETGPDGTGPAGGPTYFVPNRRH